ncbi:MAG: methyltransferase [Candidatus Aminicenantes bacterium]|nr:methyltransferase [Candidatus Aminicenantes bacterium]
MIGTVHAVAKGGAGIIRLEDRTVFVPDVIAGETVEFSIEGGQKGIWHGRLQRVLEPSPQRRPAPCRHYRECGGCNLQHMAYDEQLRCKKEILGVNLKKIAAFMPGEPVPVLPSPPFRYRSKIELQVRDSAIGFFRKKSHQLVAIAECLLLGEATERFTLAPPTLPAASTGVLQILSNGSELAARFEKEAGAPVWLTANRSLSFVFPRFGYRCGPEHFIQANLFQMTPMLGLLDGELAGRTNAGTAADLFCGGGFFTLLLARYFPRVLALESDPDNLAALRANLESNRIGNVEVRAADALKAELPPLDLAVLDPPRGGLSPALISRIARAGTKTVIYFSCDSATFARDLRLFFKYGYELRNLRLIDNFPQTDHFEIFSVLKKIDLS